MPGQQRRGARLHVHRMGSAERVGGARAVQKNTRGLGRGREQVKSGEGAAAWLLLLLLFLSGTAPYAFCRGRSGSNCDRKESLPALCYAGRHAASFAALRVSSLTPAENQCT